MAEETTNLISEKSGIKESNKDNTSNNNTLEDKGGSFVRQEEIVGNSNTTSIEVNKGGNPNWEKGKSGNPKGRPKNKVFSIRQDLIDSLRKIKKKKPDLYREIIESYWQDKKMRGFLLEIVDGKARQSMEIGGNLENPVRIIEVKPQEIPQNPDSS